ncbi:MAG TPA: SPOR domain-containing protein [Terriglobales bacterium]|nr:SPOR domain-containing protein [Terriglobales bacterium]
MASGGKRGAGERVLESKHVIGLFLLMLVFSGVFFSLGYVMGRNQYDGQVRAASGVSSGRSEPFVVEKPDVAPKKSPSAPPASEVSDPAVSSSNDAPWKFEESSKPAPSKPHLEPVPKAAAVPPASKPVNAKTTAPTPHPATATATSNAKAPLIPSNAYLLQVAALAKQDDALALAGSLQKRNFSAFVQTPQKDKFYRVQVGPFKDQKSADAAKKGLESAGFKAFYVKH